MPKEWQIIGTGPKAYNASALHVWAERIRGDTARALKILPELGKRLAKPDLSSLANWFGIREGEHSFRERLQPWLSLTETQVMAGLCHFTNSLAPDAGRAMLEALSPGLCPKTVTLVSCKAEERIPSTSSRIDLILRAEADGRAYCVVVEAKLGSSLATNPLAQYRRHALKNFMKTEGKIEFIILDYRQTNKTKSRMNRNKDWRLLSWFAFLSRLERELMQRSVDSPEYKQLRSMIWCQI